MHELHHLPWCPSHLDRHLPRPIACWRRSDLRNMRRSEPCYHPVTQPYIHTYIHTYIHCAGKRRTLIREEIALVKLYTTDYPRNKEREYIWEVPSSTPRHRKSIFGDFPVFGILCSRCRPRTLSCSQVQAHSPLYLGIWSIFCAVLRYCKHAWIAPLTPFFASRPAPAPTNSLLMSKWPSTHALIRAVLPRCYTTIHTYIHTLGGKEKNIG